MLEFPEPDLKLLSGTISIALTTIAFLICYLTSHSSRINNRFNKKFNLDTSSIRKILFQRSLGAVLYGLMPILVIMFIFQRSLMNYGFNTENLTRSIIWWIPVAMLVVVISYFSARKKDNLAIYPQIRVNRWNSGLITLSALSWITYLAGYEFIFRGFLLFSCLESFGYWPAIIINICLYALVHLPKGSKETIGSLFLGFVLCYLTIRLGSFWFAFLAHVTLALSNEWFSLAHQPEMTVVTKRRSR